jgi:LPS export ABC transporter protein LptC
MKFSHAHLNTPTNRILALLLLWCVSPGLTGQITINSPYSRFGIGVLNEPGSVRHFSMGGVNTPLADVSVINFQNPGTYSSISETVFQWSLKGASTTISDATGSSQFRGGGVNEVAMGFKKAGSPWAVVFGLTPYSSSGYSFERTETAFDSVGVSYRYAGDGGLNRLVIGTSRVFEAFRDTTRNLSHRISAGFNVNYLFGTVDQSRRVVYDNTQIFHSRASSSVKVGDFFFNAGIHYMAPLRARVENKRVMSGSFLHIGADYTLGTAINTKFTELGETFYYFTSSEITADTSYINEGVSGWFQMPSKISAGAAYFYQNSKGGSLTLAADYRTQDWSNLRGSGEVRLITPNVLQRYQTIAIGAEYLPESLEKANRFHRRVTYRAGVRRTETNLALRGQSIRQLAVSAGFSIPLMASRSGSRLHAGVEWSEKGSTSEGLIREEMWMVQFGVTLHPFERWFYQKKIRLTAMPRMFHIFFLSAVLTGCRNEISEIKAITDPRNYPVQTSFNAEYLYTVKGGVRNRLEAKVLDRYLGEEPYLLASGGFTIVFYDSLNTEQARLRAMNARYEEKTRRLLAWDKVELVNAEGEMLETEELIFAQDSSRIYTDKFVRITTTSGVITGDGLESNETFTRYRILKPRGDLYLEQ